MATVSIFRLRDVERGRAGAPLGFFAGLAKRGSPLGWTKAGSARSFGIYADFVTAEGPNARVPEASAEGWGLGAELRRDTVREVPARRTTRPARASGARGPARAARARHWRKFPAA